MTTQPITHLNRQRGFSLIEALVAFLILSVGMLGIASLQTVSLRAGYTATLRSAAVQENQQILERIRTNSTALAGGSAGPYAGTFLTSYAQPATLCSDASGSVVSCTPTQMAKYDLYEWMQSIKNNFPSGTTATITINNPPANTPYKVDVTLNWTQRSSSNSNATVNESYFTEQYIN